MPEKKLIAVMGATGAQGGGLARAILADRDGGFAVRAVTRKPDSDAARALAARGAEVVAGDSDDPPSLERALTGAYGAYCVTNYWEHLSAEREGRQAAAMARATRQAGLRHVVWSTLEDTRRWVPLADTRLPTIDERYKVPHFDSKGQMDPVFATEAAPTSYLLPAFYWENLIHFGIGPRAGSEGELALSLPLGGARLPGIGVEDIGRCAYGIFRRGPGTAGQRFGIAGEILSGPEMAERLARALRRKVVFVDIPFDVYRGLGFPGARDLGNMFEFQMLRGEAFLHDRDPAVARALNPELQDFAGWLTDHASRIPLG